MLSDFELPEKTGPPVKEPTEDDAFRALMLEPLVVGFAVSVSRFMVGPREGAAESTDMQQAIHGDAVMRACVAAYLRETGDNNTSPDDFVTSITSADKNYDFRNGEGRGRSLELVLGSPSGEGDLRWRECPMRGGA